MASIEKKADEEVKLQYGFFPEMKLDKRLILGISLLWTSFFLKKLFPPPVKPLPVCADAHTVEVGRRSEGAQKISQACLSGIVMLPRRTKFGVTAPGAVTYWIETAGGYRALSTTPNLRDRHGMNVPGRTFRMSGDPGIAKIRVQ